MRLISILHNVLHKTSKGVREMSYQDTQQFKWALRWRINQTT